MGRRLFDFDSRMISVLSARRLIWVGNQGISEERSAMKIAIIGAGRVGQAAAARWAGRGHNIRFGVRHPDNPKIREALTAIGEGVTATRIEEATRDAEVVVLAVPFGAAEQIIRDNDGFKGKILVDCTNPLLPDRAGLSIGHDRSGGETIAGWAPRARVVKALSTTGTANMRNPNYPEGALSMLICGNDAEAKRVVFAIVADLGFDVVDAGPIEASRLLEPVAMLWINLAFKLGNGPDIGFRLLRR
jgi:8-hydroxy-5-deazaflavin:NADPH oxidoreductase